MEKLQYPQLGETLFRQKLANGLTVAVLPRPGFRRKIAYLVTDWGSMHRHFRRDGKICSAPEGTAHYLEHKLFDMPDGRDISGEFAALGAYPNAFTAYDMTAFHFSCTEHFDQALELLLDLVGIGWFSEEGVTREREIIGQEIDMNADTPESRVFENLMLGMYRTHPVRETILGTRDSIGQITPEVLTLCHDAWFSPENMLLCVVGDVDPAQIAAAAARLPQRQGSKKIPLPQEELTCPAREMEQTMEVSMPMFQLGFKCMPIGTGEEAVRREIIGDLAAEALFGESSPLYLKLYESGLIDGSFGGGFDTLDDMAMLTASGDSLDPEAIRQEIFAAAEALLAGGIDQEQFLRMKRSALGRRIRDLDSFESTCFRLCAYHFLDFDYLRFPEIYSSVEAEDILAFLKETIREERCCLSVVWPPENESEEDTL